jgi:hypothetical protein
MIGLNGVKYYAWAPKGFVSEYHWNSGMVALYYPLYLLDTALWHTSDKSYRSGYPVNTPEDIMDVYRAWDDQTSQARESTALDWHPGLG